MGGEVEDECGLVPRENLVFCLKCTQRYLLWAVLEFCHFRASPPDQAQIKHLQRLEKQPSASLVIQVRGHLTFSRTEILKNPVSSMFWLVVRCSPAPRVAFSLLSRLSIHISSRHPEAYDSTYSVAMSAKSMAV